jgi:hypothetical protein
VLPCARSPSGPTMVSQLQAFRGYLTQHRRPAWSKVTTEGPSRANERCPSRSTRCNVRRRMENGAQVLSSCTPEETCVKGKVKRRPRPRGMVASERDPPLRTVSSPGSGCSVFGFPAHGQGQATRNGPIASDLGADNRRGKGIHAWFVLFLY